MRTFLGLLLPAILAAQSPAPPQPWTLDLATDLGTDPLERIHLVAPGCWDGLMLGASRPATSARRGTPGAMVEVWDFALPESPRTRAFARFMTDLRQRLLRAMELPPPNHGSIELGEFMLSDPSNPQRLDLTKVKSMQERYNRLPPNGSPVK